MEDLDRRAGAIPNEHFGVVLMPDQPFTLFLDHVEALAKISLSDLHELLVLSVSVQLLSCELL